MAKKNVNLFFGFVLSCFAVFGATFARAETTGVLSDDQKQAVIKQIEAKWKEFLAIKSGEYAHKVSQIESFSYSYQYSDSYINTFTYSTNDFRTRTITGRCILSGQMSEKKLDGWNSTEKKTIQANGISIPTDKIKAKFFNTSYARQQMSHEKNPDQGMGKCLTMADELDAIKTNMQRKISEIKTLLAALNTNNAVNVECAVDVPEGEECQPEDKIYTIVTESGTAATGASKGCVPLPVKFAEIKTCILCPLFNVILRTDQTMATKSFSALAIGFRNLIIVVLALYIAWQTLITVSAFTKQDAPKYIGSLLVQAFKVLVAALLLSNPEWIYYYVINPLMGAGLEFGLALLFKAELLTEFNTLTNAEVPGMPDGVISQTLLAQVMASIRLFNKAAAQMPAIGSTLMCISWHEGAKILPDFSMLIEGLLIWGFGWAIVLAASFYLLDSAVRFGIFCTLLPFLIAAWPFKVTAKYTKTGWDIFMNCFFNFVMMGLVIGINSELIAEGLSGGKGGMDALIAAINGDRVDELKELMDISGTDFLVLVACCLFAFKLVGQINALATEMAGGGGSQGIGNKIGGAAMQGVKKATSMGAKVGGSAAGFTYEATGAKAKVAGAKAGVASGMAKMGTKVGLGSKASATGAGGGVGGNGGDSGGSGNNAGGGAGGSGGNGGGSTGNSNSGEGNQ